MTLEQLVKIRKSGRKPDCVFLLFGDIAPSGAMDIRVNLKTFRRQEWRALVGCEVVVMADDYSNELVALMELLQGYVSVMTVYVLSWMPHEFGFVWEKGNEMRAF